MGSFVVIDRAARRVEVRTHGQWDLEHADRWYVDMATIHSWSSQSGEPISIFADLRGMILHTQEVSRRVEESVALMREFPLDRYALIVPSFLMRMQCRRLLTGIPHSYFETSDAARRWLGWETGYRIAA